MPVLVPTAKVLALCDPFRHSPWEVERVTKSMVREALRRRCFSPAPVAHDATSQSHASRIAFLAAYGWDDSIDIDIGIPSMSCHVGWPVLDGNHRLGAASIRGDEQILATIGGDLDYAFEIFGVDCEEVEKPRRRSVCGR